MPARRPSTEPYGRVVELAPLPPAAVQQTSEFEEQGLQSPTREVVGVAPTVGKPGAWTSIRNSVTGCVRDLSFLHRPLGVQGVFVASALELALAGTLLALATADTSEEYAGSVERVIIIVYLLVPHNSIITLLSGISFERLIRYHTWFALAAGVPMALHGNAHHMLTRWHGFSHTTGNIMFLIYMAVVALSLPPVRRHAFEVFYWLHVPLTWTFMGLALVHHDCTWKRLVWPALLVALDAAVRARKAYKHAQVVEVSHIEGAPATELTVAFTDPAHQASWRHEGGQFVWINLPSLGRRARRSEWHPASISSSPVHTATTGQLTFHLRSMGVGTWSHDLLSGKVNSGDRLRLDGPYGVCSVPYELCEQVVLVGGGIGITPMMSTVMQLVAAAEAAPDGACGVSKLQRVHLVWVLREPRLALFFRDAISRLLALQRASGSGGGGSEVGAPRRACQFQLTLHVTGDYTSTTFDELKCDVSACVREGRPNWAELMACEGNSPLVVPPPFSRRVAVLTCGPEAMMAEVARAAYRAGGITGARFHVHEETFEL